MLTACATAPTSPSPQQLSAADYGPPPTNAEAILKEYFEDHLKDPSSAQYKKFTQPEPDWAADWQKPGEFLYGYRVCVTLNAKNSYGAYVGNKTAYFLIKNDAVIYHISDTEKPLARDFCP